MRYKNFKKVTALCFAGAIAFSLNVGQVEASPYVSDQAVAGMSKVINEYYDRALINFDIEYDTGYDNLGIANVSEALNVRKGPGEDNSKVGQLPKDGACEIIEIEDNGWAKIKSGKIEGYVDSSYLLTGEEAEQKAEEVASLVGIVTGASTLRVREEASLISNTIDLLAEGAEVEVVELDEFTPDWIKIKVGSKEGFVASEFIDLSYELEHGVSIEELQTGTTGVRAQMVSFARQYLGGRYVWGGTRLGSGVDCSGYTQAIYRNFGYSIPRVSRSQAVSGTSISASDARPGDLFFYGNGSYINHVGMYIGNGQIIHASSPRTGIIISNAYYDAPIKVVRYIHD